MVTDGKETCAGARLAGYTSTKSILCAPEANALYVNYTSVKGKKKTYIWQRSPERDPGTASHLPWRDNLPVLSLRREGAQSHQRCEKQGTITQKHPQGPIRKEQITEASFHQALLAKTAETAGRLHGQHHSSRLQWELKDSGQIPKFWFVFLKEMEEGLGFDQPAPYALWGILFFLPKYVGQSVSLCIFPLSFFLIEDFMKVDREETKAFV